MASPFRWYYIIPAPENQVNFSKQKIADRLTTPVACISSISQEIAYHQGASLVYHPQLVAVYHQHKVLYIIKPQERCTLRRDEIQPQKGWWYTNVYLAAGELYIQWYAKPVAWIRKKHCFHSAFFWRREWDLNWTDIRPRTIITPVACISSISQEIAYHQGKALYIINTECCISSSHRKIHLRWWDTPTAMIYTLKRDDIPSLWLG